MADINILVDGVLQTISQEDWNLENNITPEIIAEEKKKDVRHQRNALLAETDWWAVADRTMTQAEIDYRQALRDIPQQEGFPTDITWPTKP